MCTYIFWMVKMRPPWKRSCLSYSSVFFRPDFVSSFSLAFWGLWAILFAVESPSLFSYILIWGTVLLIRGKDEPCKFMSCDWKWNSNPTRENRRSFNLVKKRDESLIDCTKKYWCGLPTLYTFAVICRRMKEAHQASQILAISSNSENFFRAQWIRLFISLVCHYSPWRRL